MIFEQVVVSDPDSASFSASLNSLNSLDSYTGYSGYSGYSASGHRIRLDLIPSHGASIQISSSEFANGLQTSVVTNNLNMAIEGSFSCIGTVSRINLLLSGGLSYTPPSGYNGNATFVTLTVDDLETPSLTATSVVNLHIESVDDPAVLLVNGKVPSLGSNYEYIGMEDVEMKFPTLSLHDPDDFYGSTAIDIQNEVYVLNVTFVYHAMRPVFMQVSKSSDVGAM